MFIQALKQFLFLCFLSSTIALSQNSGASGAVASKDMKKEEPDKVSTGVIASTAGKAQQGAISVQTGSASPGDEQSAISGSVSYAGKSCVAKLINGSEKTKYKVRYQVIGKNSRGSDSLKKSFSGVIKPKQTISKKFSCRKDLSLSLNLREATPL